MDYERIHNVQMGVISPSKLRIKLLGSRGVGRKKEGGNSSSRASPSKLEEMEHSRNSLLAADFVEEVGSLAATESSVVPRLELSVKDVLSYSQGDQTPSFGKDILKAEICCNKTRDAVKSDHDLADPTSNLNMVHPVQIPEDDRGFEFHKRERLMQQQMASSFLRNLPSKWNDAERWIPHRQIMHLKANLSKKVVSNKVMLVPELQNAERHSIMQEPDSKWDSLIKRSSQTVTERFSSIPSSSQSSLDSITGTSGSTVLSSASSSHGKSNVLENPATNATGTTDLQSVSMRDVGTEMTPLPSQDPSRTGTPVGATTPIPTPLSSIPANPKKEAPASSHPKLWEAAAEHGVWVPVDAAHVGILIICTTGARGRRARREPDHLHHPHKAWRVRAP